MSEKAPSRKVVDLRKATPKDAIKIFRVVKEMFEATDHEYPLVDEDTTITWIMQTILNGGLVYVAEVSGRVVGSLGFEISEFPWVSKTNRDRWYLSNVWFYIHPKYRTNQVAEALIQKAKIYANEEKIALSFNTNFEQQRKQAEQRFLSIEEINYGTTTFMYMTHLGR